MLFRVKPRLIVHDAHPDYLSTRFAHERGLPTIAVQHHYAHIAAVSAEHGIDEQVIGVALDGTGYGDDGTIWGGEFLIAGPAGYERFTHLRYVGMPGGDKAAVEPWRMAASYLFDAFGEETGTFRDDYFTAIPEEQLNLLLMALRKGINAINTSSAGRLFDAIAALCGLCPVMTFEAEAAMRLEALCGDPLSVEPYPWRMSDGIIDVREMIRQIVNAEGDGRLPSVIATRFHATVIAIVTTVCTEIRKNTGLGKVVLSGGCFQNRYILEGSVQKLQEHSFSVYTHHFVPCNDGGIALGQIAVGAWKEN
jgi:hydrogenase maturation protein HypF